MWPSAEVGEGRENMAICALCGRIQKKSSGALLSVPFSGKAPLFASLGWGTVMLLKPSGVWRKLMTNDIEAGNTLK